MTTPSDDALTDCLVGEMLQVGQWGEITGDGSGEALPEMDEPLWRIMQLAYGEAIYPSGEAPQNGYAAEIEALRDWLFIRTCHTTHSLEVRDLLTEQARLARGDQ